MTQDLQKVSIIIPCYNSEEYIQECIESVLQQDYKNIEVIVIDDGSTDNSVEKLKPYLNKIILITQENQGACIARNKGLEVATGEFIKFLDSDDYLEKNIISSQVKKIKSLDDRSIVFGDLTEKHPEKLILKKYHSIDKSKLVDHLILHGIVTSQPLHRKNLLMEIGGFDPRLKNWQEWNLHLRLAANNVHFVYLPGNVYFWRFHESPDRISNQKNIDPDYEINKRKITLQSIKDLSINQIKNKASNSMAYSLWIVARNYLSSDNKCYAQKCYTEAQEMSPDIITSFSISYRISYSLLGLINTEKLIIIRKKFTRIRKLLLNCRKRERCLHFLLKIKI